MCVICIKLAVWLAGVMPGFVLHHVPGPSPELGTSEALAVTGEGAPSSASGPQEIGEGRPSLSRVSSEE